jgi:Ca2+-dependent lipid-binding protein
MQMLVYPNQIPIPLMENSGLPKPPVGMLEVTLQKCTGLRNEDIVGNGDPYVKISVLTMGTSTDKHGKEIEIVAKEDPPHFTGVKHSKNPEFNEHFKARGC